MTDAKDMGELEHLLHLQSGKHLEVGLVPSGEMGDGSRSQRGPMHVPSSCYICSWEFLLWCWKLRPQSKDPAR